MKFYHNRPLIYQPASHPVIGFDLFEDRLFERAPVNRHRAARMEAATLGRIQRAGYITLENGALALEGWVSDRDGRHQGLGVWMQRIFIEFFAASQLDHLAQVHHGHAVGDMLHHAQVVGNEQISKPELL